MQSEFHPERASSSSYQVHTHSSCRISVLLLIFCRKYTGERPFQCHCGRRFSSLDNLRLHAQTVHVNEEIPGNSLATTGTRFQRQIRIHGRRLSGGRPRSGMFTLGGSSGDGESSFEDRMPDASSAEAKSIVKQSQDQTPGQVQETFIQRDGPI